MTPNKICALFRDKNNMSAKKLGELCGVSKCSVQRYEDHRPDVTAKTASKIEMFIASKNFQVPTTNEVIEYYNSLPAQKAELDVEKFFNHYTRYGWRIKDSIRCKCKPGEEYRPMLSDEDWKIAVNKWCGYVPPKTSGVSEQIILSDDTQEAVDSAKENRRFEEGYATCINDFFCFVRPLFPQDERERLTLLVKRMVSLRVSYGDDRQMEIFNPGKDDNYVLFKQ